MPRSSIAAALAAGLSCAGAACPPPGESLASMQALEAARWRVDDEARRQGLALALVDCLADPDPRWRDRLAATALNRWMRAGELQAATLRSLRATLIGRLREPADAQGFAQPFAALTLAEVARVDRLSPFLSADELDELLDAGVAYLAAVRDFRGFEPASGWRHGVAHGADLLLQLSLNPRLDAPRLLRIVEAVRSQVAPPGHFYVFGEGERLAAPVFYAGRRDLLAREDWDAWFAPLAPPAAAGDAVTPASLAARHDRAQFLLSLHASLRESGTPQMQAKMLPGLLAAIRALD